jgi:hypothetical protein
LLEPFTDNSDIIKLMNKTYIPALASLILLATAHFIAGPRHWYYLYPGFDIPMHIVGGMGLAFSIYWILATFFPRLKTSFWSIILLTFMAGLAWELFEAINDIAGAPVGTTKYYFDFIKDLVNDTLGAIIASFLLKK